VPRFVAHPSAAGLTTGELARVTVAACCAAIFIQKIPRSGENRSVCPTASGVQGT
jgi:hypothetical protein